MPFNITEFRAQFAFNGTTSPAFFECLFTKTPQALMINSGPVGTLNTPLGALNSAVNQFGAAINNAVTQGNDITPQSLKFLAEATQIPGRAILQTQYKDYGVPYQIAQAEWQDTPLTIGFIVPRGLYLRKFFQDWQHVIVDSNTYDVAYYSDYVGEMVIMKYDPEGNLEAKIKFLDIYPSSISPIDIDWGATNQILKLNVGFTYRRWYAESIKPTGLNAVISTVSNIASVPIGSVGGFI